MQLNCPCLSPCVFVRALCSRRIWWAKESPGQCNINQITAQDTADMGAGAILTGGGVRVEPIQPMQQIQPSPLETARIDAPATGGRPACCGLSQGSACHGAQKTHARAA